MYIRLKVRNGVRLVSQITLAGQLQLVFEANYVPVSLEDTCVNREYPYPSESSMNPLLCVLMDWTKSRKRGMQGVFHKVHRIKVPLGPLEPR